MSIRPATHSGSWYTSSGANLLAQLERYTSNRVHPVSKARILVGPHAGFSYSGARLGPSHHVYFRNYFMISAYDYYDTPVGKLPVDTEVNQQLNQVRQNGKGLFRFMDEDTDEEEHSFEMHCPFIRHRLDRDGVDALIVPIMVGACDAQHLDTIIGSLQPYFEDPQNTFVISSDFCHWGSRFGYTSYVPQRIDPKLQNSQLLANMLTAPLHQGDLEIHESIEILDKTAMDIASHGTWKDWHAYIQATRNTICGEKPIMVVLQLIERVKGVGKFQWIGYSQSSSVTRPSDSSVSYASGYAVDDRG